LNRPRTEALNIHNKLIHIQTKHQIISAADMTIKYVYKSLTKLLVANVRLSLCRLHYSLLHRLFTSIIQTTRPNTSKLNMDS